MRLVRSWWSKKKLGAVDSWFHGWGQSLSISPMIGILFQIWCSEGAELTTGSYLPIYSVLLLHYLDVSWNVFHAASPSNFFRMRRTGFRNLVGQTIHIGLFLAASLSWLTLADPIEPTKLNRLHTKRPPSNAWNLDQLQSISKNHRILGVKWLVLSLMRKIWYSFSRLQAKHPSWFQCVNKKHPHPLVSNTFCKDQACLPHNHHQSSTLNGPVEVLHRSSLKRSLPGQGMSMNWMNYEMCDKNEWFGMPWGFMVPDIPAMGDLACERHVSFLSIASGFRMLRHAMRISYLLYTYSHDHKISINLN